VPPGARGAGTHIAAVLFKPRGKSKQHAVRLCCKSGGRAIFRSGLAPVAGPSDTAVSQSPELPEEASAAPSSSKAFQDRTKESMNELGLNRRSLGGVCLQLAAHRDARCLDMHASLSLCSTEREEGGEGRKHRACGSSNRTGLLVSGAAEAAVVPAGAGEPRHTPEHPVSCSSQLGRSQARPGGCDKASTGVAASPAHPQREIPTRPLAAVVICHLEA
jgi:hypothetical protein